MKDFFPKRIVCMTEETTEMLYILGEQDRIVGISGFTMRPPIARKEKPKVSQFTTANIDEIIALRPDLVLGFSDLQADIAAALIRKGINVHIFNQRSIDEILEMIVQLGATVGQQQKAVQWVQTFQQKRDALIMEVNEMIVKPKVYFEEWYDPVMTGIQWVAELIELVGGDYCFPENAKESLARNRILADPGVVVDQQPDIILVSWCGKKFKARRMLDRPGWDQIPAVKNGRIYELPSEDILQPGPAALTDGLEAISKIIKEWVKDTV
jgi:iron complex transport system substrate-binding protein